MGSGLLGVGDRVAGFAVEAFVARGGMAVVYRATDLRLSRTVALKVMAPELASDAAFRHRFTRECELAASIDHPNVIPIYAAGEEGDLLYLVMRFVPGDHLGAVLKQRGRLEPPDEIAIFGQVGDALDAAHAHGLVHRDVKPGNILLAGTGDLAERHVYLSDFGLTTKISTDGDATTATEQGVLGTLKYVAPERVTGNSSDHRADIYSFGCVLYEALAGQPPFVRQDEAAWLYAHVSEVPPLLSQFRPDLPADLDGVFVRALAKNPADRYADCRSLMRDTRLALGAWDDPTVEIPSLSARSPTSPVSASPIPASPGSASEPTPFVGAAAYAGPAVGQPFIAETRAREPGRWLPVLVAVLVALVVAAIVTVLVWPRAAPVATTAAPGGGGKVATPTAGLLPQSERPLPDDVFVWRHFDAGLWKIETASIDGTAGQLLLTARENRAALLSPDRRTILYLRELGGVVTLRATSADGQTDKALFSDGKKDCPRLGRPALRADGTLLAVCYEKPGGNGKLNVMSLDGRVLRTLDEGRMGDPTLSPDGTMVVYWRAGEEGVVGGRLRIARVDGSDRRTLLDGDDGELADPAWSPTSNVVVYRRAVDDNRHLLAVAVSDERAGKPRRLTSDQVDQGPSWSPDGSRIAFRRGSDKVSSLVVMASDGSDERVFQQNQGYSASPIWTAR